MELFLRALKTVLLVPTMFLVAVLAILGPVWVWDRLTTPAPPRPPRPLTEREKRFLESASAHRTAPQPSPVPIARWLDEAWSMLTGAYPLWLPLLFGLVLFRYLGGFGNPSGLSPPDGAGLGWFFTWQGAYYLTGTLLAYFSYFVVLACLWRLALTQLHDAGATSQTFSYPKRVVWGRLGLICLCLAAISTCLSHTLSAVLAGAALTLLLMFVIPLALEERLGFRAAVRTNVVTVARHYFRWVLCDLAAYAAIVLPAVFVCVPAYLLEWGIRAAANPGLRGNSPGPEDFIILKLAALIVAPVAMVFRVLVLSAAYRTVFGLR